MSHFNRLGKIAELKFNTICIERGLACLWPSLDIHGYDCAIERENRFYKIQIKSRDKVSYHDNGRRELKVNTHRSRSGKKAYDISEFDFLEKEKILS